NDDLDTAAELSPGSGTATGTTVGATEEVGEPHPGDPGGSVWYRWAPASNGRVSVGTGGTRMGTVVRAYLEHSAGDLGELAEVRSPWLTVATSIEIPVRAGSHYAVSVEGIGLPRGVGDEVSKQGPFSLSLSFVPAPANDDLAN